MIEATRVAKGTTYLTIQNIVQYVVAFAFYVAIARVLSQAAVGEISLLLFTAGLFGTLTQLAIPIASEKFVSENLGRPARASAAARMAFKIILATSMPAVFICVLLSPQLSIILFGSSSEALVLASFFIASTILNLVTLLGYDMLGLGMFAERAAQSLIFIIVGRVLAVLLAWFNYGVYGVALGWILGAIVGLIASFLILKGHFIGTREIFPARTMLAYSYPIYVYSIITLIRGWVDVIVLYTLTGSLEITAIYYLSMAGASVISIFWTAITSAVFPAISARYATSGADSVAEVINTSAYGIGLIVIPAGVVLASVSQTVIVAAYGPIYLYGVVPFALLTFTAIIPAYFDLFSSVLQAIGRTKVLIKIGALAALTDLIVIVLLAKLMGVIGAAIARVAMVSVAMVLSYHAMKKDVEFTLELGRLRRPCLFAATLAIPLVVIDWTFLHVLPLPLLARASIELVFFISIAFATAKLWKPFTPRDFDLLRRALPEQFHGVLSKVQRLIVEE